MEHTSILNQKKHIRNITIVLSSLMLILVGVIMVDFSSDFIAGWKAEGPGEGYVRVGETDGANVNDAEDNTLDVNLAVTDENRALKTVVSFIFVISIMAFIIYVIRMIVFTLKGSCIDGRIEAYLVKIGLCLTIVGISGIAWDAIFKKLGDGTNMVIIISGIVYILLSEIFKLARLYKEDSELSV